MKNVVLKIGLLIATLLGGAGSVMASNLPPCPSSGYFHNCFGTYTWDDTGNKYVGEWKNDVEDGQGTLTWANGAEYVGEWKYGKRNGQGTLTRLDKTVEEGIWKDNEFLYAEKRSANTNSSSGNSKLDKHKEFCEEIGFTPGSEKFAECVMVMIDTD